MRVLGIIPARSGSKGIPGKNTKELGGKPLIQYTAEAAFSAKTLTKVVLSTDSEKIATIGKTCGLEVPFLRPKNLARDDTSTLSVILHTVKHFEKKSEYFDTICLLQPTSPFRESSDIDDCVYALQKSDADSVVSVQPVPEQYNPNWVYEENQHGYLQLCCGTQEPIIRRQDLPKAYYRDGSIYLVRRDVLIDQNSLYGQKIMGFISTGKYHINLDTKSDWREAEKIFVRKHAQK